MADKNGIHTNFFVKDGRVLVRVQAGSSANNQVDLILPAEDIDSWYSLYFYLDYNYKSNYKDLLLVADKDAPQYIKDKLAQKNYHFSNFYDPVARKPVFEGNFILKDNTAIENKLQDLGLTTWNQDYTIDEVNHNYDIISNTIFTITNDALRKQKKMQPKHGDEIDDNTYSYASDKEMAMLVDAGVAFTMNNVMSKIVDAKMEYLIER